MNIEALVEKVIINIAELPDRTSPEDWPEAMLVTGKELSSIVRAALTEQAETHAIELRAREATVANFNERIRQLEAERVPDGWKMVPLKAIDSNQQYSAAFNLCGDFGEVFVRENRDFALAAYEQLVKFAPLAAVPQQKEGE